MANEDPVVDRFLDRLLVETNQARNKAAPAAPSSVEEAVDTLKESNDDEFINGLLREDDPQAAVARALGISRIPRGL